MSTFCEVTNSIHEVILLFLSFILNKYQVLFCEPVYKGSLFQMYDW